MKKLVINEKYLLEVEKKSCKKEHPEIFEKFKNDEEFWKRNLGIPEIDLINYQICNTSSFRYSLHEIVKYCFEDNKNLHNSISNKNFTGLILAGIIDVVEE